MQSGFILPFKPKKGEAFRLVFKNFKSFDQQYDVDPQSIMILKDYGAGVAATNSVTHISDTENFTYSMDYIQLTASEMDADIIMVDVHYGSGGDKGFIIYTDGFTGFGSESGGGGGISMSDEIQAFAEQDRDGVTTLQNVLNLLYKFLIKNANRRV